MYPLVAILCSVYVPKIMNIAMKTVSSFLAHPVKWIKWNRLHLNCPRYYNYYYHELSYICVKIWQFKTLVTMTMTSDVENSKKSSLGYMFTCKFPASYITMSADHGIC